MATIQCPKCGRITHPCNADMDMLREAEADEPGAISDYAEDVCGCVSTASKKEGEL